MELPAALRIAIDAELEGVALADLRNAASILSQRYRAELRDGRLHLSSAMAVKAYLAARMPATFAAISTAMQAAADAHPDFSPSTHLDVGAGPGTALWAAASIWPSLRRTILLEASRDAAATGARLAAALPDIDANWTTADANTALDHQRCAGLVTLCYVLDELSPEDAGRLVETLWRKTEGILVIVEPGTPAGWRRILTARDLLVAEGAFIAAPCPHAAPCPLAEPDWCHFSRRVARSRVHRLTKDADVPWEDEKFAYLIASRTPSRPVAARVLAPPRAAKGRIDLKLCRSNGQAAWVTATKRDAEAYRVARRIDWGDTLALDKSS